MSLVLRFSRLPLPSAAAVRTLQQSKAEGKQQWNLVQLARTFASLGVGACVERFKPAPFPAAIWHTSWDASDGIEHLWLSGGLLPDPGVDPRVHRGRPL